MSKIQALLAIIIIILVTVGISFLGGIFWEKNSSNIKTTKIDAVVILDRIQNEAFLVTKTVYVDQQVEIKVDQGSDWSNFWWGQTITAQARMKVSVGVDFAQLKAEDILIDKENKIITVNLPASAILQTGIDGDIKVVTQSGVFKWLFDNDSNKDYNTALSQLTQEANNAINANADLLADAREDSIKILKLVLNDTGYEIKIAGQTSTN